MMKKLCILFIFVFLGFALCAPAAAVVTVGFKVVTVQVGGEYEIPCGVWYPALGGDTKAAYDFGNGVVTGKAILNAAPNGELGPLPIIVYSHGYSGCSHSSVYLTESLARYGFIVIAPDHTDDLKACSLRDNFVRDRGYGFKLMKKAIKLGRALSSGDYDTNHFKYRYMEVSAAVDWIVDAGGDPASPFYGLVDSVKIGIVGHSLGAYSALAVSGAVEIAHDPRIGAVVAMSGPGDMVFTCKKVKGVKIPAMLMYGGDEKGRKEEGLEFQFRCLSRPKFLLVISGADHLTFAESVLRWRNKRDEEKRQDVIVRYVNAFFEYFIKGQEGAEEVLKKRASGLDGYDFVF
jgi:predicted dienelactone hydrolase